MSENNQESHSESRWVTGAKNKELPQIDRSPFAPAFEQKATEKVTSEVENPLREALDEVAAHELVEGWAEAQHERVKSVLPDAPTQVTDVAPKSSVGKRILRRLGLSF